MEPKKIYVEVIISRIKESEIEYIYEQADITGDEISPDQHVISILSSSYNVEKNLLDKIFIHSTSWRYDTSNNSIILTYLVYSDYLQIDLPYQSVPIAATIDNHNDNIRPSQTGIQISSVINHAIRHLAYLYNNNQALLIKPAITTKTEMYLKQTITDVAGEY